MEQDKNAVFDRYSTDWAFLAERLEIGSASDVEAWAHRWTTTKSFDPVFLAHHGVLKTFAWFVVDHIHPEIPNNRRAEAKTAVFDVLDGAVTLDEAKRLRVVESASVDWPKLRQQIDADLKQFGAT